MLGGRDTNAGVMRRVPIRERAPIDALRMAGKPKSRSTSSETQVCCSGMSVGEEQDVASAVVLLVAVLGEGRFTDSGERGCVRWA
jgi:hypothetical protein